MGSACSKDDQGSCCALVLCKRQCGNNGCCMKDSDGKDNDGQCCASVCCGVQCNVGLCFSCIGSALGGALCCAGTAVQKAGLAAGGAAAGAASAGAEAAAQEVFGSLCHCSKACCCAALPWNMACLYADNAARIDGDSTPYCVDCGAYLCTSILPPCGCCRVAGTKRTVLRAALGMERQDCNDKCTHFFCPCCALLQEQEMLDRHNFTKDNPASKYVKGSGGVAPVTQNISRGASQTHDAL